MNPPETDIDRQMQDDNGFLDAVRDARIDAIRRHAKAGVNVVVWRDGKVVELPPDVALAERLRDKQARQSDAAA